MTPHHDPHITALQNTCVLVTPDETLNAAFRYAKDNIARSIRYYTHGWGMSNAPHNYAIVVGRDTGWMSVGCDYVAEWMGPAMLQVFRDRQKANGQILEYICLETGKEEDYGLNISDNTPLYIWAVHHHAQQYQNSAFLKEFLPSVERAAGYLLQLIGNDGLITGIPIGVETQGIFSWRNIIPGTVLAGEVTELNAQAAWALRMAADLTGDTAYSDGAQQIADAVNNHLWTGEQYLLTRFEGKPDAQPTGDLLFPILCGVAPEDRARQVLERLSEPDFWTPRGLRTVPTTSSNYHPREGVGLLGGSWPNLTLWYAACIAPYDVNRALDALRMVVRPVVEFGEAEAEGDLCGQVNRTEFAEWFDGETHHNSGMRLSPWVAPTFIWAVMEGLLGVRWQEGAPSFQSHWPNDWQTVSVSNLPMDDSTNRSFSCTLQRDESLRQNHNAM